MYLRIGLLALLATIVVGIPAAMASSVKEPDFTVLSKTDDVELRMYAPLIRAETVVSGPYPEALNGGFRILANYIFGGNAGSRKIAMTAPVGAVAGEKIAMTAPVGAESTAMGWVVSFVMPEGYSLETLPQPLDPRVVLREVPAQRVACLGFSGRADIQEVERHKRRLLEALQRQGLEPAGPALVAQYNPPWTLPFMRRNEILISVM